MNDLSFAFSSIPQTAIRPREIGFLLIGGEHQMLHLAPVAARLAEASDGRCVPRLYVGTEDDEAALRRILDQLGACLPITRLTIAWARKGALKVPRLVAGWSMLRKLDALVVAERTSTMLKFLPGRTPPLIHIPHGAGDRARGFESRICLFDHVIVAGEKDRERMVGEGLVEPDQCSVSGYVKLCAVLDMAAVPPRLFADDKPIVLYNPHFARRLGSWKRFARSVVKTVLHESDANLVIAPHVRLARSLDRYDLAWLDELAADPRVLVDLGSTRSSDMTYTLAADLYVGDVSSQVYEYLHLPKPCVFLNASGADWSEDPSFAFWRFGEVVDHPADLAAALARAEARHPVFASAQVVGVRRALGAYRGACTRAAMLIDEAVSAAA